MQDSPLPLRTLCLSLFALVPAAHAQWSPPALATNLNTPTSEFDPSPTFDGLMIYFSSGQAGNPEIFRATRAAPYASFGAPTQVAELAFSGNDSGPCVRIDNLEIFFESNRPGGTGSQDLWRADRASTGVPFNTPVPVAEAYTTGLDLGPSLTADGRRMYFFSNRAGGAGNMDIWTAIRPSWSAPFGTATPVAELNTAGVEYGPHISPDGLVIFFASDRPGGVGGTDIWMASRLDPNAPFGNLTNVTALNSTSDEYSPGFSIFPDEIFFTSNRPGGSGSYDTYGARFTGLLGYGIAGPGSAKALRFSDPASPGALYLAASALGSMPGIQLGTRVLPLNYDLLMQLTVGGLPPVLTGFVGLLDNDGIGAGRIDFTGFPQMVGLRFVTAFVVLDQAAPLGIKTISNAHETLVQ